MRKILGLPKEQSFQAATLAMRGKRFAFSALVCSFFSEYRKKDKQGAECLPMVGTSPSRALPLSAF
jgi:hypothetical protein